MSALLLRTKYMFGSLSKLRFKRKFFMAQIVPRSLVQNNLASALFALSSRASSQVRPYNAGTAFSKPGGSPFFAIKKHLK